MSCRGDLHTENDGAVRDCLNERKPPTAWGGSESRLPTQNTADHVR